MGARTDPPPRPTALSAARAGPCPDPWCGAAAGQSCTFGTGPDGDHFARYVDAVKAGRIRLGAMHEVIAMAEHIAAHPIIPAEFAEDVPL
jgi:hypothetical protein